jgi:hypothetical protein
MKSLWIIFPFLLILAMILESCQKEDVANPTNVVVPVVKNDCFPLTDTLSSMDSSRCICTSLPAGVYSGTLRCPVAVQVTSCTPYQIDAYVQIKNDRSTIFTASSFEYCSYDPTVIRVDRSGVITGIKAGRTTVTVCLGTQSREVIVEVIP